MVIFDKLLGRLRTKRQGRPVFPELPEFARARFSAYASDTGRRLQSHGAAKKNTQRHKDMRAAARGRLPWHPFPSIRWTASSGSTARSSVGRREDPRADPRPALCERVFEGERAYGGEIFKLDEHTERLHQSARAARLRDPLFGGRDRRGLPRALVLNRAFRRLCAADRLARQRDDGRLGAEQPHQLSPSPSGNGRPISARRERLKGIRLDIAEWRRPDPRTAPSKSKAAGLYMICTHLQARGRAQGLCRRADVRLARPGRRGDRRQHLLRQGRQDPHADARLLPRRHHPPHGDRACQGRAASR